MLNQLAQTATRTPAPTFSIPTEGQALVTVPVTRTVSPQIERAIAIHSKNSAPTTMDKLGVDQTALSHALGETPEYATAGMNEKEFARLQALADRALASRPDLEKATPLALARAMETIEKDDAKHAAAAQVRAKTRAETPAPTQGQESADKKAMNEAAKILQMVQNIARPLSSIHSQT